MGFAPPFTGSATTCTCLSITRSGSAPPVATLSVTTLFPAMLSKVLLATVAVSSSEAGAFGATATVSAIGGAAAPTAMGCARVQRRSGAPEAS